MTTDIFQTRSELPTTFQLKVMRSSDGSHPMLVILDYTKTTGFDMFLLADTELGRLFAQQLGEDQYAYFEMQLKLGVQHVKRIERSDLKDLALRR